MADGLGEGQYTLERAMKSFSATDAYFLGSRREPDLFINGKPHEYEAYLFLIPERGGWVFAGLNRGHCAGAFTSGPVYPGRTGRAANRRRLDAEARAIRSQARALMTEARRREREAA